VSNIEYIFTNYWNTKSEKEIKDYLKTISIEKLKNVEDEYDKELSKNNSEIDDWYNKQSDDVKKVADFGMVIS
jgi:phosphoserine aminotransferase